MSSSVPCWREWRNPTRGIDNGALAKELRVVAEELRVRQDLGVETSVLATILPPTDPASRVSAQRNNLGAFTLDDLLVFADRSYAPARMTLVISGAVGADWDDRLLALLPPKLRGQATERRPPVRRPQRSPPLRRRRPTAQYRL